MIEVSMPMPANVETPAGNPAGRLLEAEILTAAWKI
jgi:hypothetical protein